MTQLHELREDRTGRWLATVVLTALVLGFAGNVSAQVDTPTAQAARTALHKLQQIHGARSDWNDIAYRLGLGDIEHELRLGDRAEPAILKTAAAKLRAGAGGSADASFPQLADAVEQRAAELATVPRGQWPAECRRQAEQHAVVTPAAVLRERSMLFERLNALERTVPTVAVPSDAWSKFLYWRATRELVFTDTRDLELLARLAARWQGAPLVWDAPELVEASLAVQSYIPQYRAWLTKETAEEHAAAWNELAALLESDATSASPDAARIATLLNERESLGQGSALTSSIRREFSRPNVILQARTAWLQDQLSEKIDDRYTVNDVYAGVRQYGQGTISGTMRCRILPSQSVGYAEFLLDATSRARTRGSSEGVSVTSTATTRIRGRKPLTLDADGLGTSAAVVSANASVAFKGIDSPGRRRRRAEAERQTYARRPQAEASAAADARRETAAEMDKQGRKLVQEFNKSYLALRDRQFDKHRPPPEIRVRANADTLRWECRLESPALFAAPGPPPKFESTADVTLCLAASALEEQALTSLAGRHMTGGELSKAIAEMMGSTADQNDRKQDFTATFGDRPCEVAFADGQIRTKFYITAFDSDDVKYPAMTVDAAYNVEQREGELTLVRQGSLRVRPWNVEEDKPAEISGRQQTLRVAVQRKLNRALSDTYVWATPELPIGDGKPTKMRVEAAQVDGGWLQVALKTVPAKASAKTPVQ